MAGITENSSNFWKVFSMDRISPASEVGLEVLHLLKISNLGTVSPNQDIEGLWWGEVWQKKGGMG